MLVMTPKEKAEELIDTFDYLLNPDSEIYDNLEDNKESSLIVVEQMMNIETISVSPEMWNYHFKYWQQVKQEIENL